MPHKARRVAYALPQASVDILRRCSAAKGFRPQSGSEHEPKVSGPLT